MAPSQTIRQDLRGKRITIFGMARAGLACALLGQQHGARVFVTDQQNRDKLHNSVEKLAQAGFDFETGGHTDRAIVDCDLIVLSPGVPLDLPVLRQARDVRIPIISEIELGWLLSQAPVLAVTGSNGKTTTTSWLGKIYETAGMNVEVGGNIGRPYADAIRQNPAAERMILEISSFQLEAIDSFCPHIGVILNVTPDHLDRHTSMADYIDAKLRLFENQRTDDIAVINFDDPNLSGRDLPGQGLKMGFALTPFAGFGVRSDETHLRYRMPDGEGVLLPVGELGLPGAHNLANAAAAACVALADRLPVEAIATALQTFKGVEHRLEYVNTIDDVRYINDSKATNPDSVRVALEAIDSPVVLIMGGLDKGTDYSVLFDLVRSRVRRLICTGKAADKIAMELGKATGTMIIREFDAAVSAARKAAQSGDVVLLSPGCASFDAFENYEERGKTFKDVVAQFS